ncbi:MAG: hypothetical protein IKW03_04150 [Clostridia bacterium]|nr:hypothetical protein [Clostridia bacterium]
MDKIIAFFMSIIYSILSFFGIPFDAPDLATSPLPEVVLTEEEREFLETFVETERAYIAGNQIENGAIPMTYNANAELNVNPYFACYAVLALLDDAETYADEAKAYFEWHFAHLNTEKTDYAGVDGTIYDHLITVENGIVTGEKMHPRKYDSSDSYAAIFLTVLNKYYKETGDAEYIISKRNEISRVVNAMTATMHNGLAFACPDYKIKFLMDNSEVYEGAVNGTELFEKVICPADSSYNKTLDICKDTAEKVSNAIETKMWDYSKGYYQTALNPSGTNAAKVSWTSFYPSATSQLFAISCGVISPETERAKNLYATFCEYHDWEHLNFNSEFCWGSVVIAAAKMNDKDRVITYAESYNEKFGDHAYPLYSGDAGRAAHGVNIILENAK